MLIRTCLSSKNEEDNLQTKASTDNHTAPSGVNPNSGSGINDWLTLKSEIDNLLQNSHETSDLLQKSREVSDYWNKVRTQMRNG